MAEDVSDTIKMDEKINETESIFTTIANEIIYSPLNLILLTICVILLYKIFKSNAPPVVVMPPTIPKLKKQDMTLECLLQYDGNGEHNRVCTAVNGKIFDVTRGKRFYGPGGPYSAFAGCDATRALATFKVDDVSKSYDDLSDLTSLQMDSVREWEMQFNEKYDYIGRLLKPGEEPAEYSDDEKEKSSKKDD